MSDFAALDCRITHRSVERGQAPRLRFRAPPEVAVLTLR